MEQQLSRSEVDPGGRRQPVTGRAVDLEEGLGFRLDRVQRNLRAGWAAELATLGLTPPLAATLRGVRQHPGTCVRGLSRVLGADVMTVKRRVDALEARGLVRTTLRPDDRRLRCLEMTPAGRRLVRQVDERLRAREAVFDGLTPGQLHALEEILTNLERRLDLGNPPDGQVQDSDERTGDDHG